MFAKSLNSAKLDAEINAALEALKNLEKTSEEYGALIDQIAKLHKLKCEENPPMKPISLDTVLVVSAHLLGILWVTNYERTGVITTKAFGNAMKLPR